MIRIKYDLSLLKFQIQIPYFDYEVFGSTSLLAIICFLASFPYTWHISFVQFWLYFLLVGFIMASALFFSVVIFPFPSHTEIPLYLDNNEMNLCLWFSNISSGCVRYRKYTFSVIWRRWSSVFHSDTLW